jgi:hypothetical protein
MREKVLPVITAHAFCIQVTYNPDSVIDVLQEEAQAFRNFRGDNGKLMTWLKRTVNVLHILSTSSILVRVSVWYAFARRTSIHCVIPSFLQPFPPAKAIFAGMGILLGVSVLFGFP